MLTHLWCIKQYVFLVSHFVPRLQSAFITENAIATVSLEKSIIVQLCEWNLLPLLPWVPIFEMVRAYMASGTDMQLWTATSLLRFQGGIEPATLFSVDFSVFERRALRKSVCDLVFLLVVEVITHRDRVRSAAGKQQRIQRIVSLGRLGSS